MRKVYSIALGVYLTLLVGCASNAPQRPATWDGFEYRQTGESGALYVRPGAHVRTYRTVVIDPLVVTLDKNWLTARDVITGVAIGSHPPSPEELHHIEDSLGRIFHSIFVKELSAGGYRVVEGPGRDTLRVSPGLADVYMNSPNTEGRMTLVTELADPWTSQSLARFVDTALGAMGSLTSPNSVVNNRNFRRTVRAWAQRLRAFLDEASGNPV